MQASANHQTEGLAGEGHADEDQDGEKKTAGRVGEMGPAHDGRKDPGRDVQSDAQSDP